MRKFLISVLLAAAAAGPLPALAEETPALAASVRSGAMLVSADGRRIGRIDRIVTTTAGQPLSAAVILDSRFVYVPIATLSAADGGRVTTSLNRDDLRRLP